ncbi:hypothetical protein IGI04_007379 [Brassica rapa subsp. trilocularis]|uniref:Uncharacterized protein n=1 Tax=Brassica rapa subsp. trilocularis TaxID=1813537 RepID=A0ABQ7NJP6_BRACM|nr:hypothetical protein IGI04_007379 [Brassica rapa subsp. trilocularis]
MGHYAIRRVTCEALYGDSNTLVPGIRKRAAHKTETITTVCSWPDRSLQRLLRRTINRAKSVACLGKRLFRAVLASEEEGSP